MKTFWFESKKIAKRKTTWIAILLSLIAVVAIYFFNYVAAVDIYEGNNIKLKNDVIRIDGYIESFAKEKMAAEEAGDSVAVNEIDLIMDGYEGNKELKQEKLKALEGKDWQTILKGEISELNFLFEEGAGATTPPISIEDQDGSWFTLRATLEEKQYLLDNQIIPFVQNTTNIAFLPTVYDNFTGKSLEQWEKMTYRYGVTGYSFLYQLIQVMYIPIIVLIGSFIFGNSIASESSKKRRGLLLYAVLPFRKGKLFIAKYASGLLFMLGFSLIMLIVPIICSLFTDGIGSLDYPVLVYDGPKPNPFGDEYTSLDPMNDSFHFISLKEYMRYALLFMVVFAFFLYSLYFILSLFVKNPGVAIILTAVLIFIGMNIYPNEYNPITYMDIDQLITGKLAVLDLDSAISYKKGLLIMTVVGILATIIGFIRFRYSNFRA